MLDSFLNFSGEQEVLVRDEVSVLLAAFLLIDGSRRILSSLPRRLVELKLLLVL